MPLYTFFCNTCETEVSLFLSVRELRKNKACPECKGCDLEGPIEGKSALSNSETQISCGLTKKS